MVSVWSTAWLHRNLTEQKVQKRNRSRTLIDYLEIYFAPPPPPPPPVHRSTLTIVHDIFTMYNCQSGTGKSRIFCSVIHKDNQMMYSTLVMMTKLTFKAASKAALSSVIIKMQYLKGQFQLVPKLHNNLSSI